MKKLQDIPLAQRKSHFRNLVAMAGKDGAIGSEERSVLAYVAAKWGLSDREVAEVSSNPNVVKLAAPDSRETCFQQLYDLVEMMIIDGVMKKDEKALCQALAQFLGFPAGAIDRIAQGILEGNRQGQDETATQADLRRKLGVIA